MADKTLSVVGGSRPLATFLMTTFRNEADPSALEDITGWAAKFMVKRHLEDDDSAAVFELDLTVDAALATLELQLSEAETGIVPGSYFGEIRWWHNGDTPATDVPRDKWTVDYIVQPAVSE